MHDMLSSLGEEEMKDTHSDAELMYRMARTLGVDLRKQVRLGSLGPDTLKRLEHHCMVCSSPRDCAQTLESRARGSRPTNGQWAPGYCINRKFLVFIANLEKAT